MIGLKKETVTPGTVVFQKVIENAQGGFTLDDSAFSADDEIAAGTVIGFDETTRKAKVGKIGVLQANATDSATAYRVLKGHNLKVGMSIKLSSGNAQAITAIDDTDPDYDELTVGTTIGVAGTAGDAIYVEDDGYTKAKGLLYEPVTIPSSGNADVAVVLRGTVYENRINPVPATMQTTLKHIIFSKSF